MAQDPAQNMTHFAQQGVIGVKMNYRLGGIGFISYYNDEEEKTVGGNYGLMDQQMAIQFVVDNCPKIGCDPNRVTIFGESAGGAAVSYQLMNRDSAKLFQTAILQSPWTTFNAVAAQQTNVTNEVLRAVEKDLLDDVSATIPETLENLSEVSFEEINRSYLKQLIAHPRRYPGSWQPISQDGVFYVEDAMNQFMNSDIPFEGTAVIGTNSYEGDLWYMFTGNLTFTPDTVTRVFDANYILDQTIPDEQKIPIVEYYFDLYKDQFPEEAKSYLELNNDDISMLMSFIYGDPDIYLGAYQKAQIYEKAGLDVFTYHLDGHPQYDWILEYQTQYAGLGHAAEIPYEFGSIYSWHYKAVFNGLEPEGWEVKMTELINQEFSSFFKTGAPTQESSWEKFNSEAESTLFAIQDGSENLKLETKPALDQSRAINFWFNEWSPDWPNTENDTH